MALTYRFYRFKFRVLASHTASTSSPTMSGPNSPNLDSLDYQVWGQCWSLITSLNRSQRQFPGLKLHFSWFGLPYGESHW